MTKDERNVEICRLYVAGTQVLQIARQFHTSKENVRQILRKNNISKKQITRSRSNRDEFIGVNVSVEDKKAFRSEAARQGISMSKLTSKLIKELLAEVRRQREAEKETSTP
jgi:DNA-binding NarL/FixJ family response regulator